MANNIQFLQGAPGTDVTKVESTLGALYLKNYVKDNKESNRLFIGTSNAVGGILPIVTPTPYSLTLYRDNDNLGTFDGSSDLTVNFEVVPLVASTDNAIARFDGTTGYIQNSKVIIDDNGSIIFNTNGTHANMGVKWSTVSSKNPYIGYATDQSDGTFALMSIEGTNYASGLAIGGSSGVLLWKGNIVPTLSAATVGSNIKPVWVNDKSIVASDATVGGDLKPAYLKAGTITETQYTMAALEVDQTFTGINTFNKKISASGGIDVLGKASIDTDGYVIGTWLRMTAENTRSASAAAEICIKHNGWIYTRTPSEILQDMGVTASSTELNILDGATITISGNTITGNLSGNATSSTTATNATNLKVNDTSANTNYFILGAVAGGGTNQTVYRALNGAGTANTAGVYFNGASGVLYGAAWNDYAEFRKTKEEIEPGRVVIETGKGDLILSTKRLQPGVEVVSDTFGFAIGETEDCKTPIAVSGRVLVYPYERKENYKPGDAVCSGPNGTVSKMTRKEIKEYPERIIGTVSEIPEYEIWGQSGVKVNGRIWIRIR